jgi:hypothetical protein
VRPKRTPAACSPREHAKKLALAQVKQLAVEIRIDPDATPGDLDNTIVELVLARARAAVAEAERTQSLDSKKLDIGKK